MKLTTRVAIKRKVDVLGVISLCGFFVFFLTLFRFTEQSHILNLLESDAEMIITRFESQISSAQSLLMTIREDLISPCSEASQKSIRERVFYDSDVKWIGIFEGKRKLCSTYETNNELNLHSIHSFKGTFSLAVGSFDQVHEQLFLVSKWGGKLVLIDLNDVEINKHKKLSCQNCVSYALTINGKPELHLSSLNSVNDIKYKIIKETKIFDVKSNLKILASPDFKEDFALYKLENQLVYSGVISLFITVVSRLFLSRYQSREKDTLNAIKNGEFVPFYQPIVDVKKRKIIGAEVLLRRIDLTGRVVPPAEFIEYLENSDLILPVTKSIVKQVAKDIHKLGWNRSKNYMSLNIVPSHLQNDDLINFVVNMAKLHKINTTNFAFEITERKPIENTEEVQNTLAKIKSYGIDLKLDDAGTGYGGFSSIQEFGISSLKIDRMFVKSIFDKNNVKLPVLDAIISFSKESSIGLVAEGVESIDEVNYLSRRGVHLIQGFFFGKPMPLPDFIDFCDKFVVQV